MLELVLSACIELLKITGVLFGIAVIWVIGILVVSLCIGAVRELTADVEATERRKSKLK